MTPSPTVPLSLTPGAWPRRSNENPVWYVLYLSFVRRHRKFGFKLFEFDLVIEIDLMIFDLLAPPQGPRGRGPPPPKKKKKKYRCVCYSCKLFTHKLRLNFGKKWPQPPRYPQVPPLGHDPGRRMKIPSNMFYIFHLWVDTQSLV